MGLGYRFVMAATRATRDSGRVMKDKPNQAAAWEIRCLTCGQSRDAAAAGMIRVGAVGRKRTLGWCSRCRRLRCCVVERIPERGFEVVRTQATPE